MVIDSAQDVQRPIWYAISQYEYLPNALIDLAARERVGPDPKTGIRKLRNIYFMTKLSGKIPAIFISEDERKIGYGNWVIKEEK